MSGSTTRRRLLIAASAMLLVACSEPPREAGATDPLAFLTGPNDAGFARAEHPRTFAFPADHAAHEDFRTEWWYLTGNLEAEDGRALGFQITIFRFGLAPGPDPAGWASNQLWLGQLAISDLDGDRFFDAERLSRGLPGVAEAGAGTLDVRVEDWRIHGAPEAGPLRIVARDPEFGIDLSLTARRAPVLQGEAGLSQKGRQPGNASYYYSIPRLTVEGRAWLPEGAASVTGSAWLDREWSTSALEDDQGGWDWFALQLADGTDVMVYRLRTLDGGMHEASAGVIVAPDGTVEHFGAEALALEPLGWWESADTRRRYPTRWRVAVGGLDLEVAARRDRQEHTGRFEYWEGAVRAEGTSADRPIDGVGYLEMTGYD